MVQIFLYIKTLNEFLTETQGSSLIFSKLMPLSE